MEKILHEPGTQQILEKIRQRREALGYSQEYVASKLDISQNSYSKMELGKTQVVLNRILYICRLLNLSLADLINSNQNLAVDFSNSFYTENIPMWLFEPDTQRIIMVNDCAIKTYGYSRSQFLKLSVEDLYTETDFIVPPIPISGGVVSKTCFHKFSKGRVKQVQVTQYLTSYNNEDVYLITSQAINN